MINVSPGSGLKAVLDTVRNDTTIHLGDGRYTVTPSILNSNLSTGSQFQGLKLLNRTNITIEGIPGQSIIDGSAAPGEVLWISNCSNIRITGVTVKGYTNHNFVAMPPYPTLGPNGYLWAGVNIFKSEFVTVEDCDIVDHFDHGIQDKGAENNTQVASSPISTNNIIIRDCRFRNIGSMRTNATGGATAHIVDGTCIVPTGWTIDNCSFSESYRGIEPYDESDANGQVFNNTVIRDCNFRNMVEWAIGFAGSTNGHNGIVANCKLDNDSAFSWRGTNFGPGQIPWPCQGYIFNGGRGWLVSNNSARGGMYIGFRFGNTVSFLDDFTVTDNTVQDINRGDGLGFGYWIGSNDADAAANASAVRRMGFRGNKAFNCPNNGFIILSGRDIVAENNFGSKAANYLAVTPDNAAFRVGQNGFTVNRITNLTLRANSMFDNGALAPFGFSFWQNVQNVINDNNLAIGFTANDGFTNVGGFQVQTEGIPRIVSANLDFPSVAASGASTLTMTATGATTNDTVQLSFPAASFFTGASAGVIVDGWASNDVVYVRVINNDAVSATVDFPSTRFTAEVRLGKVRGE